MQVENSKKKENVTKIFWIGSRLKDGHKEERKKVRDGER